MSIICSLISLMLHIFPILIGLRMQHKGDGKFKEMQKSLGMNMEYPQV